MSKGAKIAIAVVVVGALVYWYYVSTAVAPAANTPTGAGSSPSTGTPGGTTTTTLPNGNTLGVSPTGLTLNGTNITPTSGQAPISLNPLALFTPAQAATRSKNVAVSLSNSAYAALKANRPSKTGSGAAGTSSTGYVAPTVAQANAAQTQLPAVQARFLAMQNNTKI